MKKTLLLTVFLVLLMGMMSSLFAQTIITVGEGTATNTTSGIPTPYGTFYKNFRQQYLILASELENAGGGTGNISSVAFNVQTPNTCSPMPGFTIRMKQTAQTTLTTTFEVGDYTTVFSSTEYLPVAGWNIHTLTTPFNWNGGSNILVDIITTLIPGSYTQNASVFYTPTTFQSSLRFQSDSVDAATSATGTLSTYRANIQFNMPSIVVTNPPNPSILVSPANAAILVNPNTNLNWQSGGGLPTGYRLSLGTNNPPTNLINNQDMGLVNTYDPPTDLNLATTYYWKIVPYNAIGNATNCPVWSFTTYGDPTITTLPYNQNWDLVTIPDLPFDWSSIYQATVTTGYVKTVTTTPQSTPNCVAMYNPTDVNTIAMLIAPPLSTALAANTVRVKFYAKGSTSYAIKVGVMTSPTDPATFVEVQTITLTSAWVQYSVPLTTYAGTGKYIAFKHASSSSSQTIYIDGVDFELIAANDLAAVNVVGNSTPSMNNPAVYTVNVFNNGTASQSTYSVKLYNAAGTELATAAGTTVAAGATVGVPLTWTPAAEGPVVLYGKVILAGDINAANNQTPNLNITVMPAGILSVTIGDGGTNARMPIDMYYKNSVNQTLYFPDEIGMIGNILSLSLYNNFTSTTIGSKPIKIWMGTTTQNDLSAGWIPASQMTLVFDGSIEFPSGENTLTFPLSVPFAYAGGNLVIMWHRPLDTGYFSSLDYFKCQIVGTNRALNIYNDTTVYDPNAMPAGTLTGTFPKISLVMTPMTGDPVFMVTPATKDFGTVLINTTNNQSFSVVNAGGGSLTINSVTISGSPMYSLQNVPTLPVSLNTGQTMLFTARYSPTAAGTHAATITITDNLARSYEIKVNPAASRENRGSESRVAHTVALSGNCIDTTINALPYAQAFDAVTAPALPPDWSSIYQASVTTGYVKTVTTTPQSAPNCVTIYNSSDAAAIAMLIAPPLNATMATNTVRVKFYGKGATTYAIKVGVMTSPT
ncbi:MAG: choice-of-anchor D domain-containing protein, partial [Candidatus Cloacimonetes bacterium]|nr:choice-of-anchor D domain-containing protein [Candidatus Cloacimonadota bacterium]